MAIIKKCQRCGKYFVPVNRNAEVYCNLPNVDGSATCREKGAKEKYTKSLDENEGLALYRRTYQIEDKVVRRNKKDKQLKQEFEQWKKDAKEKVNLFKANKISERELIEWLDDKRRINFIYERL